MKVNPKKMENKMKIKGKRKKKKVQVIVAK